MRTLSASGATGLLAFMAVLTVVAAIPLAQRTVGVLVEVVDDHLNVFICK